MASIPSHSAVTFELTAIEPGNSDCYTIRMTPKKGYGVFAAATLARGTMIMNEKPLLRLDGIQFGVGRIRAAFKKLTAEEKKVYMSLASNHDPLLPDCVEVYGEEKIREITADSQAMLFARWNSRRTKDPTEMSIFACNSMGTDSGAAVMRDASRINHACTPNAIWKWNDETKTMAIILAKDVVAGAEITVGYTDPLTTAAWRKKVLKIDYHFDCTCVACEGDLKDKSSPAFLSSTRRQVIKSMLQNMQWTEEPFKVLQKASRSNRSVLLKQHNSCQQMMKLFQAENLVTLHYAFVLEEAASTALPLGEVMLGVNCLMEALFIRNLYFKDASPQVQELTHTFQRIMDALKQGTISIKK